MIGYHFTRAMLRDGRPIPPAARATQRAEFGRLVEATFAVQEASS